MKYILLFLAAWVMSLPLQASKVAFYVPPVVRINLDPEEWELPYIHPAYYHAKTFEPSQTIAFKGRLFNLEIKIFVKYFTPEEEQYQSSYAADYKPVKNLAAFRDFEPWQTRYTDAGNKEQLIWISHKIPNFRVYIQTNARIDDPYQVQLTEELLSNLEWVDPSEIDRAAGYPIDKSKYETLAAQRKAILPTIKQDAYSGNVKLSSLMKDVQFGFTYAEYHRNKLQIARKELTEDRSMAYALGFLNLAPWNLIDSMSRGTGYYGTADNSNTFFNRMREGSNPIFRPFLTRKMWHQTDSLTVCQLISDTLTEIWVNRLQPDGSLQIKRTHPPTTRWKTEKSYYKKDKPYDENQIVKMLPDQSRFIMLMSESNAPTPQGLRNTGPSLFYLDTQSDPLEWVSHPGYETEQKCQLLVRERLPNPSRYESDIYYSIVEYQSRYTYPHELQSHYDNPDLETQKIAFEERCKTDPKDIVIAMDVMTLDLNGNGAKEKWKVWVSNGRVVEAKGMEISDTGCSLIPWTAFANAITEMQSVKNVITKSKEGYAAFSNYDASDFVPRIDREFGRYDDRLSEIEIPWVSIHVSDMNSGMFHFSDEKKVSQVFSQMKYPEVSKKNGIGGMVQIEIKLDSEGRIQAVAPQNEIKSMQPLVKEALRLTALLPAVKSHYPDEVPDQYTMSLLFYFQP
jgi:hypothetical protein